jgi:amino acid transporter
MLFTYTIYAFCFVFLYNSATNAMQFANQVLISSAGPNPNYVPDQRLLRFIAVSALTFVCLLHYFSGRAGRALNQVLAMLKIVMLVVVLVAGIVRVSGQVKTDWSLEASTVPSSSATAFLQILFSFSGWENATFVSNHSNPLLDSCLLFKVTGEIANHQILKRGFISAVWIVGILYVLVNLVFVSSWKGCRGAVD